jgi:hypothetical protein
MKDGKPIIVILDVLEAKKHSWLYKTNNQESPIKSVYVMKSGVDRIPPTAVKVTVEGS